LPAPQMLVRVRTYAAVWRMLAAAMTLGSLLTAQQWPRTEVRDERLRWFYDQRTYPLGTIPPGARLNAVRRIQKMSAASRRRNLVGRPTGALAVDNLGVTTDSASWRSIGPQPTDRGTTAVTAARVSGCPQDSRPSGMAAPWCSNGPRPGRGESKASAIDS